MNTIIIKEQIFVFLVNCLIFQNIIVGIIITAASWFKSFKQKAVSDVWNVDLITAHSHLPLLGSIMLCGYMPSWKKSEMAFEGMETHVKLIFLTAIFGIVTGSESFYIAAFVMLGVNLFNLLVCLYPNDGAYMLENVCNRRLVECFGWIMFSLIAPFLIHKTQSFILVGIAILEIRIFLKSRLAVGKYTIVETVPAKDRLCRLMSWLTHIIVHLILLSGLLVWKYKTTP